MSGLPPPDDAERGSISIRKALLPSWASVAEDKSAEIQAAIDEERAIQDDPLRRAQRVPPRPGQGSMGEFGTPEEEAAKLDELLKRRGQR